MDILVQIALNLGIVLGSVAMLTILILPIQGHRILVVPLSICVSGSTLFNLSEFKHSHQNIRKTSRDFQGFHDWVRIWKVPQ